MNADSKPDLSLSGFSTRILRTSDGGGYCFVKQGSAPADFQEEAVTIETSVPDFGPETAAFVHVAPYRDPELCSCRRMREALRDRIREVSGVVPSPLAPTDETVSPHDHWDAFRFCPFEDEPATLIDDQVPMPEPLHDGCYCCATMRLAVECGRVALPAIADIRDCPRFVGTDHEGRQFLTCPWCATPSIDLALERVRSHLASR